MEPPDSRPTLRQIGAGIGVLPTGALNAITDVAGVRVGHRTRIEGDSIRTGVTAILPHGGNLFVEKVPAAVYAGNGFGKLAGISQIEELGQIETPIVLTNTLAVGAGIEGIVEYTLTQPGNQAVRSVNAVVGETNDGMLNDIRARCICREDVLAAIVAAAPGKPAEGCVGAGTGTVCFGFKGGIGTSSRVVSRGQGGFTIGVLAQTNFDGLLQIDGAPVGKLLGRGPDDRHSPGGADGSCMLIVATDAPLDARQLGRIAKRAFMGLARTGGTGANGSGDYAIAFSTAGAVRIPHGSRELIRQVSLLNDDFISPMFSATIEASEEAIVSSLFAARTTTGWQGRRVEALPLQRVIPILQSHRRIKP